MILPVWVYSVLSVILMYLMTVLHCTVVPVLQNDMCFEIIIICYSLTMMGDSVASVTVHVL